MKKYISSIVFLFFTASMLLGQAPYYVNLDDASGFNRLSSDTLLLEAAAQEIIDVLPGEYKAQFKVFDFGFNLHREAYIDGYTPAIQQAKLLASQKSPYYLLFAKETTQDGVYSKFHVEIELPRMDSNYPCLDEDIQEVVEIYVNSVTQSLFEQNEKKPSFYDEAEIAGMKEFATRINYFFNCCGGPENIICDAFLSNRKIASDLSNKYIHPASQFVEFTNIDSIDIDTYEYANIDSGLQIKFKVKLQDGSFNQQIEGTQNITQELDELANDNNESNEAIPFDVKVIHLNLSSYLEEIEKLQKSFVKESVTTLPSVGSNLNSEPSSYYEEIVVVDVEPGAPPIILSRVQVEYAVGPEANSAPNDPGRIDDFEGEEVILPIIGAKIAQALLKRAIYASINVGINVVMEVMITKFLGHDKTCTWSEAFWSANITGWHLAVWAVEGAVTGGMTSQVKQVVISAIASTATYVLTTDNFSISGALLNFGQGLAFGAAFGLITKKIGSAYDNYTKKYLVSKYGDSPIAKMAISEFEEVLVKFGLQIKAGDDIFEGVQRWFRGWEIIHDLPKSIRTKTVNLQATNKLTTLVDDEGVLALTNNIINKIIKNVGLDDSYRVIIKNKINSGDFDNVQGYTNLLKKITDGQSAEAAAQGITRADDLIVKGNSKSTLRFEHDLQTGRHDVDLGIKDPNISDAYMKAFQFKGVSGQISTSKIQKASTQLKDVNAQTKIVEFKCDSTIPRSSVDDSSIIREMRYQAGIEVPGKGAGINEFHFLFESGPPIIKTVADL